MSGWRKDFLDRGVGGGCAGGEYGEIIAMLRRLSQQSKELEWLWSGAGRVGGNRASCRHGLEPEMSEPGEECEQRCWRGYFQNPGASHCLPWVLAIGCVWCWETHFDEHVMLVQLNRFVWDILWLESRLCAHCFLCDIPNIRSKQLLHSLFTLYKDEI